MKKGKPELVGQKALQMSIFSPAGSLNHANLSPQQEKEQEQKMIATSGRRCYELYQNYVPDGLLRKMSQVLLASTKAWYSKQCSLTWKAKGIKPNRLLFQLVPSAPAIEEIEYGLLGTPNAQEGHHGGRGVSQNRLKNRVEQGKQLALAEQIAMLPTPQTQGLKVCDENGKTQFFKMPLLPTPTSSTGGPEPEGKTGRKLTTVLGMLPAPTQRDHKPEKCSQETFDRNARPLSETLGMKTGLRLQPAFVEWMQGYPEGWTELND